jgi:hypothetical protein
MRISVNHKARLSFRRMANWLSDYFRRARQCGRVAGMARSYVRITRATMVFR